MAFYLRGALVELMPTGLIPIPNVIIFQYNPETMTHSWAQPQPADAGPNGAQTNPLAVKGNPGESFSFTLAMDSDDSQADGLQPASAFALVSGVYTRLAALEMLLYPASATTGGLLGTVTAAIGSAFGASSSNTQRSVPANKINTVLFVWGPGRIVPVRVTGLTITERIYDKLLNPTHAEAQLQLTVLTDDELKHDTDTLATLAKAANTYSQGLRQALAIANLGNAVDSIVGMLPI